ncbi:MAG TPA: hypothetical protein VIH61_00030 [Waddliaceae bacterium]
MPDAFDKFPGTDTAKGDAFDRFPVRKEGFLKSAARTAYQIPSGIAQAKSYPLDLLQMAGIGHALDPEELEHLRKIHEREGIPFDEEKYLQGVQSAGEYFPTQGNIERLLEEKTGAPLTPKNKIQKALKLGSLAGAATPGSLLQKGIAAVGAPSISGATQAAGLPEGVADVLGLGVAGIAGAKTPGELNIGKANKPSGLTERRFEKLGKPKEVSSKKIAQINEKIENDFRNIASDIIEKSPIEETYSNLKQDIGFKKQARESFKDVEKLADQLPEKFSTVDLEKELVRTAFKKKGTGFTPSEYDTSHKKFIKDFLKKTPKQDITAKDLVTQYRKNNEALTEAYEPGQSFAYNRGKRQALTDYNKSIALIIEKKFPDSEFSNLFTSTNKKWSQIMDAEAIDKFMDKMFEGKIRFEKCKNFFEKEGMSIPFKRAMGEEGFKNFEQLMKDFMEYEPAHRMMKVAKLKGFDSLANSALAYLIHPKIGLAKSVYGLSKAAYKKLFESVLDKPQLAVTWDKGVKAFKKGDFKAAEQNFNKLKAEVENH